MIEINDEERVELPKEKIAGRYTRKKAPSLLERGLRGSSTAIALGQGFSLEEQELSEQYKEENPNWLRDGVETMINMAASLPVFAAGTAAGTSVGGPLVGAGAGFATDTAVRTIYQTYLENVKNGKTSLSFEDWMNVAKESGKSGALGAALSVAGPFLSKAVNNSVVRKVLRTPLSRVAAEQVLEAGAFTAGGAAIGHGELTFEDFRDNLITLTGLKAAHKLSDKAIDGLWKKHQETGKPPEQLLLEYKPKALETPITPEQAVEAERITKEKRGEKPTLIEKFKGGLRQIAEAEPERRELERIEKGIKKIEEKEQEERTEADTKFAKDLREDLETRIKELKVRQEAISGAEQRELKARAEKDLKQLEYAEKRKAKLQKREEKEKSAEHARELREKEKKYGEEGRASKERAAREEADELTRIEKGIAEIEAKERRDASDKEFIEDAKKEIADKLAELKVRQKNLSAAEQKEKYRLANDLKKRIEQLKNKKESLRSKAEYPTVRSIFESERQMNKPLDLRLQEVINEIEPNVKRLYSQLYKSMHAKEPRPVTELIRKNIRKAEKELKELKSAQKKIQPKTVKESASEIAKTKGNKDYVERTQVAANRMAETILEKHLKNPARDELIKSIEKDLEPMGIKLRCL